MSIYKKLFEAKKEIGKISKDSTNPFFKSKYFDINSLLEHVEPILQNHDLVLLQPIENNEVRTVIVDITDSSSVGSSIKLPELKDAQKLGSAITYFRRYTLQSLLGLQAEDDDANKAVKPVKVDVKRQTVRLHACKNKEEVRSFYDRLSGDEKIAMKTLCTEFTLTLETK